MGSPDRNQEADSSGYFTLLPSGRSRRGAFLAATAVECVLIALGLWIATIAPHELLAPPEETATPIYLAARVDSRLPVPHVPIRLPRPVPPKALPLPPPPRAMVERKTLRAIAVPVVKPKFQMPAPSIHPVAKPLPPIHTGIFAAAAPRAAKPQLEAKLRAGGFGDPYGAQPLKTAVSEVKIAQVGSFDSPVGPGAANGSGGDPGGRKIGKVGTFGDPVATSGSASGGAPGGGIRSGVFSNQAAAPAVTAFAPSASPRITPLEILAKPDPVYTAEAREHKIEGTVVLDVIFAATGSVDVLQVVDGLGYGLDQAAIAAARQIRFQPERVGGQAVSVRAHLRILFRLAY